ncbi:MAG: hypothetical protein M3Q10_02820 [Chloroflexota bacterium]|nr:hypothetical protein [Chloroflexota bacterium]
MTTKIPNEADLFAYLEAELREIRRDVALTGELANSCRQPTVVAKADEILADIDRHLAAIPHSDDLPDLTLSRRRRRESEGEMS